MNTRRTAQIMCLVLSLLLVAGFVPGCTNDKANGPEATTLETSKTDTSSPQKPQEELPWLEYSWSPKDQLSAQKMQAKPANDVVSPYIENKFKLKLKEVMQGPKDMPIEQAVSMWIAAGNLPDCIEVSNATVPILAKTGKFADLTEYAKQMPNYVTLFPEKYWCRTNIDGKQYSIKGVPDSWPPRDITNDPYNEGGFAHSLFLREDILGKLGYEFTPIDEIKKNTVDKGIKPTLEDMKIEPAIDTPQKLHDLLKKVKELNIKVNGKDLIPMSIQSWNQFHIGSMFDFGQWRINERGEVDGWFGLPGAKDYYKWITNLYNQGLLDKDFLLQKPEQYQEKIASGRVFLAFEWMPDFKGAQQALRQVVPEGRLRFIPFPKVDSNLGWFDLAEPGAYWQVMVKADMPAENIKRLTQYWDWLFSDEGQEIQAWGPEEGGLWEMKDGKKVFKDKAVENDVLNLVRNRNGADKYGLADQLQKSSFSPMVQAAPETPNYHLAKRNYPAKVDFDIATRNLMGKNSVNYSGTASYGDNTKLTGDVGGWYWGEFSGKEIAKLLKTKNDTEFDKVFDMLQKEFREKTKYDEAKKAMEAWFKLYPPFNQVK